MFPGPSFLICEEAKFFVDLRKKIPNFVKSSSRTRTLVPLSKQHHNDAKTSQLLKKTHHRNKKICRDIQGGSAESETSADARHSSAFSSGFSNSVPMWKLWLASHSCFVVCRTEKRKCGDMLSSAAPLDIRYRQKQDMFYGMHNAEWHFNEKIRQLISF